MIKGYKIRIYPTKEQEAKIWQHISSCRFIWNHMLWLQNKIHDESGDYLSEYDMIKLVSPLKHDDEYSWLNAVSATSLHRECSILAEAFDRYFKNVSRHPKFKYKKSNKQSYPVRCNRFYFKKNFAHIEKVGRVKYKSDFDFPVGSNHKFINVNVSYLNGKYFLSFCLECESQARESTGKRMGIDLGVKELAVVAYGEEKLVFHNINKSKKIKNLEQRIKHISKDISRKYNASKDQCGEYRKTNNIIKKELKRSKMYAKLSNIRKNYIHQTTAMLISMMPCMVVMEDLNITGMMSNRRLSRAIGGQCMYEFIRQMRYKCLWNGIEFVQVGRFFPSSKTCSQCGSIKKSLKLSERTYVCEECGLSIDRDYNAAINLMRYIVGT